MPEVSTRGGVVANKTRVRCAVPDCDEQVRASYSRGGTGTVRHWLTGDTSCTYGTPLCHDHAMERYRFAVGGR